MITREELLAHLREHDPAQLADVERQLGIKARKSRPVKIRPEPRILGVGFFVECEKWVSMNSRHHHMERARLTDAQRYAAKIMTLHAGVTDPGRVQLTVCNAKQMDDDNLRSIAKAVRDGIAYDAVGVDDKDPRWTWLYAQACGFRQGVLVGFLDYEVTSGSK